jgi:MraZ protein
MANAFILGEMPRTLDERKRVTIPSEWLPLVSGDQETCILAKERAGVLSVWDPREWQERLDQGVQLVQDKMRAGRLVGRVEEVQRLGRLLSTRHTQVRLDRRGRFAVPEGFREFLGVDPGGELLLVGAAVCVELWRPDRWVAYVEEKMPDFRQLLEELSA